MCSGAWSTRVIQRTPPPERSESCTPAHRRLIQYSVVTTIYTNMMRKGKPVPQQVVPHRLEAKVNSCIYISSDYLPNWGARSRACAPDVPTGGGGRRVDSIRVLGQQYVRSTANRCDTRCTQATDDEINVCTPAPCKHRASNADTVHDSARHESAEHILRRTSGRDDDGKRTQ